MAATTVPRWACTVDRGMGTVERAFAWTMARLLRHALRLVSVGMVGLNVFLVVVTFAPGILGIPGDCSVGLAALTVVSLVVMDLFIAYIAADITFDGRYGDTWRARCAVGDPALPQGVHALDTAVMRGVPVVAVVGVAAILAILHFVTLTLVAPEVLAMIGYSPNLDEMPTLWIRVAFAALIVGVDLGLAYIAADVGLSGRFGENWRRVCQERRERRRVP